MESDSAFKDVFNCGSIIRPTIWGLDNSAIRILFDYVAKHPEVINLGIGILEFPLLTEVKESAISAIQNNANVYSPNRGDPELIRKLCDFYNKELTSQEIGDKNAMVGIGVSGLLTNVFLSVLDKDDEVMIADPYFLLYKNIPTFFNAKTQPFNEDIDLQDLESKVSDKTKALIFSNPSNPSGKIYSSNELKILSDFCNKHNILMISDEIYHEFDYVNKFETACNYNPNALILRGMSKVDYASGWRIGYAFGPEEIINAMIKVQQNISVCAPTPFQKAAITSLELREKGNACFKKNLEVIRSYRDLVVSYLKNNFELKNLDGGIYAYFRKEGLSGGELATKLLEKNVLVVPSKAFSRDERYVRLCYTNSGGRLEEGLEIIKDAF